MLRVFSFAAIVSTALAADCSWLHKTADGSVYINLADGNKATYPGATTLWSKIKIVGGTQRQGTKQITIDTSDFTFTTSSGVSRSHNVHQVPYGAAMDCQGYYSRTGQAVIDLEDTPFAVTDGTNQFLAGGYRQGNTFSCSSDKTKCTLQCGGYCGYCGPKAGMSLGEERNRAGGEFLKLDVVDQALFDQCFMPSPSPSPVPCDWAHTTEDGSMYINLVPGNLATYPGASTTWNKVKIAGGRPRVGTQSIVVDTSDFTFSLSTGVSHSHNVRRVPFAAAMDCEGGYSKTGKAVIDLANTPFRVQDGVTQFSVGGFAPGSSFSCSSDSTKCTLQCGGFCGFCGPNTGMRLGESRNRAGGEFLKLDVANQAWFDACVVPVSATPSPSPSPPSCSWMHTESNGNFYINLVDGNLATFPRASTTWNKIRVSGGRPPVGVPSIVVDSSDFTFTTSTGVSSYQSVTQVPFGFAKDCQGYYSKTGNAVIDLANTPFGVFEGTGQFSTGGVYTGSQFTCTEKNKKCTLQCGGYCGYCGPKAGIRLGESPSRTGGSYLQLEVLDRSWFDFCVAPAPSPTPSPPSCDWLHKASGGSLYVNLVPGNLATYPAASTTWNKVKIAGTPDASANSVTIDTSDFTYTTSTGVSRSHFVRRVPFAAAMDCQAPHSKTGEAVIDFTNTPFSVFDGPNQFSYAGFVAEGSFSCSDNNKKCTLLCGGYCGYCGPKTAMNAGETRNRAGGEYLQLVVDDKSWYSYCVGQAQASATSTSSANSIELSAVAVAWICGGVAAVVVVGIVAITRRRRAQPLAQQENN